jgi:carbamoyltransferase
VGAAAVFLGRHVQWPGPYLGTDTCRPFQLRDALDALTHGQVIGVANGRAEFGPRALGNRSLLADPRAPRVRDAVNAIKGREPFRPFAPVVLREVAHRYFDIPVPHSPYMQYVARCRVPDQVPGVVHVDGSSRVQTLTWRENANLYELLRGFWQRTGCPILLNTSMNVKGEPLVNTWEDALRFSSATSVPVF